MPTTTINITKSYVDNQKLRLPITQFNDNKYPGDINLFSNVTIAAVLRLFAFLLFLFYISPINRWQIWTPTSQDRLPGGLRVPPYTCTKTFSSLANSYKTIRADDSILCPHVSPILSNSFSMNINSYALAVTGGSPKSGRKASEISESPARSGLSATDEWPTITASTPVNQSDRSQGIAKKGKFTSSVGSQRKLNTFFALANGGKKTASLSPHRGAPTAGNKGTVPTLAIANTTEAPDSSPNTQNDGLVSTTIVEKLFDTPSSPPNTKRLLSTAQGSKAIAKEGTIPDSSTAFALSSLGRLRCTTAKEDNNSDPPAPTRDVFRATTDPSTQPALKSTKVTMEDNDEMETEMSPVKVYPKSSKSTKTPASTKRKVTRKPSVGFSDHDPKLVQLVEPEEFSPTPKIDHPYKTVLTATVRLDKVKDALSNFISKMTDTLAFLRTHVDSTIAILPKSPDFDNDHIFDKPSFPTVVFLLNQRYFNIETRGAFMDTLKTQNGRTVKLSLILGSTVKINHQLLEEVRHDTTNLGVTFWYKPHQDVDTTTRLVFLGAPNNANKDEVKEIIDKTLQPLEQHLLTTDPNTYPSDVFGLPWPNFAVVSEQPTGQPYVAPEIGKDGKPIQKIYVPPPPERRSLHIMCKKSDYSRLATLMTVAKARNMWLKVFGMCYPVEAPDNSYSKIECNNYLKMVDVHESAQLSYGTFRISGIKDPGIPTTLRRETGDPITVSVRQIMRMITTPREIVNGKVLPGQQVWLCVLQSDNGSYAGYYAGANSKHQKFASAFAKCPAAQIRCFLIRHGILQHDVNNFIRNNFSMAQIRLIGQAKWNSRTGLATVPVQPGEENILDAARVDNSLVDLSKLTKRDFEEDDPVVDEYNGPSDTDPACYKFDSAQSVTTIQHNTEKLKATSAGKSVASQSIGETVFTLHIDEEDDDTNVDEGFAAAADPLTSLRNEEMQFDLTFLKSQQSVNNGNTSIQSPAQSNSTNSQEDIDQPRATPSSPAKALERQFNDATTDAALAAAAVGLDLASVTHPDIQDEECFALVLAGIDVDRSFAEMFEILESLIEEAEEQDAEALHTLLEINTHVPDIIRKLLVEEARESGESVLDHLHKLHGWLRESEKEEAEENATMYRNHEGEYDKDESMLLRPEDYGNEKPQGCEHSEMISSTYGSAMSKSGTDELTSRLGAHQK
jgi:hypothetical protein